LATGAKYAVLGLVGAGAAAVGFGIKSAAGFEQSRVAFGTLLGSVAAGNKMFADLQKFNLDTPFTLPAITKTSQMLLGMGFAAKDLIPTLRSVSDVASGLGKGDAGLDLIALNLGQIKTQGKATGRELKDLATEGVDSYGLVANILGVTTDQVKAMGDSATVSGDQFISAFTKLQGPLAKFSGSSLAQSKTLMGMWSNFKDAVGTEMAKAVESSGLQQLLGQVLPQLAPVLASLGANVIRVFAAMAPAVIPVVTAIASGLDKLLGSAAMSGPAMAGLGSKLAGSIGHLATTLVPVLPKLVDLFISLVGILPSFIEMLGAMIPLVTPIAQLAGGLLSFGPLQPIFGGLLLILLGYSKLSGPIKTLHAFAEGLRMMALRRMEVNAAEAGGGAVPGGQAGAVGGKLPAIGLGITGALGLLDSFRGKETVGKDLQTIGSDAALGAALGTVFPGVGNLVGGGVGLGVGALTVGLRRLIGDTARPWAGSGIGGLPGAAGLTVTSGQRSWGLGGLGSDHATGRAVDLVGPNLNAFRHTVERMGGFAEFHGSGGGRHLHAVGDTARPRPSGAGSLGGGGGDVIINIGTVSSDVDILRLGDEMRRRLEERDRDRRERGTG